jgi:hypothetical protein
VAGVWIWQWPKKDGVHDVEDGCIRSNAEGQGDDSDDRKPRALAHLPQRVTKIFRQPAHQVHPPTRNGATVRGQIRQRSNRTRRRRVLYSKTLANLFKA